MNTPINKYSAIAGQFSLKIVIYTVCVLGMHYLLYGGISSYKSDWIIWVSILIYGYFNACRWLIRKIRQSDL